MQSALHSARNTILALVFSMLGPDASADLIFTSIQFPGSARTELRDINNNGVAVGNASLFGVSLLPFVYSAGTFTPFNALAGTEFRSISDGGTIVAMRIAAQPGEVTSALLIENGVATTFVAPGAQTGTTYLSGISPNGRYLTGVYTSSVTHQEVAFAFDRLTSTLTNINEAPFEVFFENAWGVTDAGLVVAAEAERFSSVEPRVVTLVYDLSTGIRTDIDSNNLVPHYYPSGINEAAQIVGGYTESGVTPEEFRGFFGFAFSPLSTFTVFDFPGGTDTYATGNNDRGNIVGRFFAAADRFTFGFIASQSIAPVAEPHAAALMGIALCALAFARLQSARRSWRKRSP